MSDWQTCKACGRRDYFNFDLPDEIWLSVVPPELANLVVCLPCFDEFAYQKQINYIPYLKQLLFIGNGKGIDFCVEATFPEDIMPKRPDTDEVGTEYVLVCSLLGSVEAKDWERVKYLRDELMKYIALTESENLALADRADRAEKAEAQL